MQTQLLTPDSIASQAVEIKRIFALQQAFAPQVARSSAAERKAKLQKIADYIENNLEKIQETIHRDFKKAPTETLISEIMVAGSELKTALKNLKKWMKPKRVSTPLSLTGFSSHIYPEAKGVTMIIAPWNYPFNLTIKPLVSAIAAGNTVIIKPSENTPHTAGLLKEMLQSLFDEREVAVFEGDHQTATNLLALPFDHIFFTGSPQVGKIVMAAAAKHLTSVTLELGGKSPSIIDETANLQTIAERIAWGKFLNNGQTCIAPDYLLVHHSVKDDFIAAFQKAVQKFYPKLRETGDYCRIVNQRHFKRINHLLEDAKNKGAKVAFGGETDSQENFIAPTLLTHLSEEMDIMQEEIFGPVLPLITYKNQQEVIERIRSKEKPLALYIYSQSKKNIDFFLQNTTAGGTVINDVLLHYGHPNLPFGGVNNSGIGKTGGYFGFLEFTNQRALLKRQFGTMKFLYPPYTDKVQKIVHWAWRFLYKP